ncbi:ParB/RepB/Spo0J family partition protein [Paracoccus pantotrophus]|uniref:ParB/RepB/Spo0J family partition protein n=1 Tax=Paracoccus pantotrophus TaxID=82367 RepID=UPI00048FC158|nr:ParB/RepB/Spo0J family partition protein [Paracoccus pantotrophus]
MEILELPLASIEVGSDRARDLDPDWAEGLAGSIQQQGLMQPIIVRRHGDGYRLVAGLHRLEAVRLLGHEVIEARVTEAASDDSAKLTEVMENLARHELIALDRCHHLYDLKQVWERMYPETKKGGDLATKAAMAAKRQSLPFGENAPEIFGFSEAVAEKIGLSARTIRLAVKIWSGLYPPVRQRLRGTDLARKQTELKALSELPKHVQVKVLDAIENPELLDVGNVAQALEYLGGTIACDPVERRFAAVSKTIAALDDETFDSVIVAHQDRVMASLKRLGRI